MACPVCRHPAPEPVLLAPGLPVSVAALYRSAEAARACPRGDVDLVRCPACALVWNRAFDPALLGSGGGYNAALHHSPAYAAFLDRLAGRLGARYGLGGRLVVEVGCGDGHVLRLLAERTGCAGLGIDPSAPGEDGPRVRFLREALGPQHAGLEAALVVSRQALHYVPEPVPFARGLGTLGPALYAEVPNAAYVFREALPWTVFYEHALYLGEAALRRLLAGAGWHVREAGPCYAEGQYLYAMAEADPALAPPEQAPGESASAEASAARAFGHRYAETLARTRAWLAACSAERVVVWGAAGRGATFLTLVDPGASRVLAVADSNPARWGTFVPGTGHPVVGPEALPALRPHLVVLPNATYAREIRAVVEGMGMGLRPAFHLV